MFLSGGWFVWERIVNFKTKFKFFWWYFDSSTPSKFLSQISLIINAVQKIFLNINRFVNNFLELVASIYNLHELFHPHFKQWYTNQRVTCFELLSLRVASYCLLHELRVTFYMRVTSYCLLYELQVNYELR